MISDLARPFMYYTLVFRFIDECSVLIWVDYKAKILLFAFLEVLYLCPNYVKKTFIFAIIKKKVSLQYINSRNNIFRIIERLSVGFKL